MKNRYECLIILDLKGKEDSAKDVIERLEKEFVAEGATMEQIQRMERRPLAYVAHHVDAGYYVNFIFEATPATVDKLRTKLKLDADVFQHQYLRLPAKKVAAGA